MPTATQARCRAAQPDAGPVPRLPPDPTERSTSAAPPSFRRRAREPKPAHRRDLLTAVITIAASLPDLALDAGPAVTSTSPRSLPKPQVRPRRSKSHAAHG